jgi:polyhydroxybutyrate depolymerase
MKKIIFLLLFPNILFSQQIIQDSIIHSNIYRSYILYVPSSYSPNNSVPLVFNLHGRTSNSWAQMIYGDFRKIADTANFIIVHPQGLLDNTGVTHWNIGQSNVDDIGFLNSLYLHILSNYNIDNNKVYSTGMSNGGYMSYFLACNMSDKIAAIASVTGAMSQYTQLTCSPEHPTPVLEIHGTDDLTVPFSEIVNGLEYWRDYNNCNMLADTLLITDFITTDSSTVEHIVFSNCDNDITNELFKVIGGAHTWPGSNFSNGATNYDIDASVEIWNFFSKYDINGLITQPNIITENKHHKSLLKIIDFFGREKTINDKGLLFYIYDDGVIEKRMVM